MDENKTILEQFDKPFEEMDFSEMEDAGLYRRIGFYSSQIGGLEVDAERSWNNFRRHNISNESKVVPLYRKYALQIAALIVLGIFISWFFILNREVISTHMAENRTIILPDNSEVILNAESRLSYKKRNWNSDRSLNLKGEAFFKVEKGQTFEVNTAQGIVRVLGTKFNVKSRIGYFEVLCFEGRVLVESQQLSKELTVGKGLRILDNKIEEIPDFTDTSPDWLASESSFNAVPLRLVFDELKRQYDVEINLIEAIDEDKLFVGSITHLNLENALQAICLPMQLKYEIRDKTIIISK